MKPRRIVYKLDNLEFPMTLYAKSNGTYQVQYGAQLKGDLTREEAAKEFGYCLFHNLECAGKLDPQED